LLVSIIGIIGVLPICRHGWNGGLLHCDFLKLTAARSSGIVNEHIPLWISKPPVNGDSDCKSSDTEYRMHSMTPISPSPSQANK